MQPFTKTQLSKLGFKLLTAGRTCNINYATAIDKQSGIEFLLLSNNSNATWFSQELCNKKKLRSSNEQKITNSAIQRLNSVISHIHKHQRIT